MNELVVRDLDVHLSGAPILRGVSVEVPRGSITAVLGPSGCGKTTLLRAVAGFVRPTRGTIELAGREVAGPRTHVPPEGRGVGLVPQEGALFPHLDVAGNVAFGLPVGERRRRGSGAAADRVAEVLDLVGLTGYESRRVSQLSGGQQQRVALARALAPRPSVVLLDEPFSALDAGLRDEVRRQVRAAIQADGATAVLVTHDQDEALSVADSVVVMDEGQVRMHATPEEVYLAPVDLPVARFVGQVVELPAVVRSGVARCALGEIPVTGLGADGPGRATDAPGVLVVRPEQLLVAAPGAAGEPGRVVGREYFGHDALTEVEVGTGQDAVRLRVRTLGAPPEGDEVTIRCVGEGRFFAS